MILAYFILSIALIGFMFRTTKTKTIFSLTGLYLILQTLFFVYTIFHKNETEFGIFKYDSLGILFSATLLLVSIACFLHSIRYLDEENTNQIRLYNIAFISLCLSLTGVYFSNNITATWVLIEATTLGSSLLIYHRRTEKAIEAAWKYVFVCSLGILIAYLGILFLSTMLKNQHNANMSFEHLKETIQMANPLYLKLAFVFIITGYSCKMEFFPLYPIGIDANHATPSPMSAFFSTVMVNMGFISIFRIYKIFVDTDIFIWIQNVMLIAGIATLFIAAIYISQVKHCKRLFAYSTVENMGIVLLILSTGKAGMVYAIFHMLMHSLVKSTAFMRLSIIGKTFKSYNLSNMGGYWNISGAGSIILILCLLGLTAIPPSSLFISEMYLFSTISSRMILFIVFVLLICFILYSLCSKFLRILYSQKPNNITPSPENKLLLAVQFSLLALFFFMGLYQPEWLMTLLHECVN